MNYTKFCSLSENLQSIEKSNNGLAWQDFFVFGCVLAVSASIGIVHAWPDRNKSANNYMMGGRNVPPIPVAMSLATTFYSSLTILSLPVEYYNYGTMYSYFILSLLVCIVISVEIFAPMYKKFGVTSLYEYLEIRYNCNVRYMATTEFMIENTIYCGMVIYMPAVVLETVAGFDKWAAVWLTGGVCIFYTSIGGLNAVVWADTFQITIMLAGFIAIITQGMIDHGFGNIVQSYKDSDRIVWQEFEFDPRYRHTFWTIMIGVILGGAGKNYCCSQSFMQRMLACKDHRNMRIAAYTGWVGITFIVTLAGLTGMVLYKYNECCDPYKAGWVDSTDQLVPYLTTIIFKNSPGLAGVYVSAVFCGTLSTVSSGINSMSTCLVTDFIKLNENRICRTVKSEQFYALLGKIACVFFGLCCIGFAYIAANLGSMLQAALSITGMLGGPLFSIFLMGFFNPWSEATGVFVGYAIGNVVSITCYLGSTKYAPLPEFTKPLASEISGCKGQFNCTEATFDEPWCTSLPDNNRPFVAEFYSLSYLYIGTVGLVVSAIVGSVVSWRVYCKKKHSPNDLPPNVLFPPIDKMFPRNGKNSNIMMKEDGKNYFNLNLQSCG